MHCQPRLRRCTVNLTSRQLTVLVRLTHPCLSFPQRCKRYCEQPAFLERTTVSSGDATLRSVNSLNISILLTQVQPARHILLSEGRSLTQCQPHTMIS